MLLSPLYSSTKVALCCNLDGAVWVLIYNNFLYKFFLIRNNVNTALVV